MFSDSFLDDNKSLLIVCICATIFMFIAHALPFNENVIEKNIMESETQQDKIKNYIIAVGYYVVVIFICFYLLKNIIREYID